MRSGKMYPPRPFFPAVAAEELELVPESRELLAVASASLLLAVVVVVVAVVGVVVVACTFLISQKILLYASLS